MSDFPSGGLDDIPRQAAEAAASLEALKGPGEAAARAIDEAFGKAGTSLARSLGRAAADGKVARESHLLQDVGERIRDVRQGPDGWLYLLTDNGKVLRLER